MSTGICRMEISALFIGPILCLILCELNSSLALNASGNSLRQRAGLKEYRAGAGVNSEASSVKCKLQGPTHLPAFSMDGDYLIGGVFSIHHYKRTVKHNYNTAPLPLNCKGRLVRDGGCGNKDGIRQCGVLICMMCSHVACFYIGLTTFFFSQ